MWEDLGRPRILPQAAFGRARGRLPKVRGRTIINALVPKRGRVSQARETLLPADPVDRHAMGHHL